MIFLSPKPARRRLQFALIVKDDDHKTPILPILPQSKFVLASLVRLTVPRIQPIEQAQQR